LTPSLTWQDTAPGINTVAVKIRDNGLNSNLGGGYTANLIYQQYLGATSTSFTVPSGLLTAGHEYSIEIDQVVLRNPTGPDNLPNTLNQSRSFFDFSASPGGSLPSSVYLPTVGTQSNGAPAYSFDITNVGGRTIYIDPASASGYIYSIGAGNPNFQSVTLPLIAGTNSYTIVLPDGQRVTVLADQSFNFTSIPGYSGGVSTFEVLGINLISNVNPFDPEAFVTGLTFATNGNFTGTMDPVTPLPAALPLFATGLGALGLFGWRRKRKNAAPLAAA
jgi:energy-converting hydrogenase Eha subunit B